MEHSGRNEVARVPDGVLVKHHGGPDGETRAAVAAAALRGAAARGLPVPAVRGVAGRELHMEVVPDGVSGATALATRPGDVLVAIGTFARRLHAVEPPAGVPEVDDVRDRTGSSHGEVWLHGDLCPVNVLLDDGGELLAVVDWEDSRSGDRLVDLVWTEWLVRTWHPDAVPHLAGLYAAYGIDVPSPAVRREAMATCLRQHRDREATAAQRDAWDRHLAALDALPL